MKPDARLTALKLLFRLRADSRHALFVSPSSEGEKIAAELCRTEETAVNLEKVEQNPFGDQPKSEDVSSWREQRKTSGSSPHASVNRHTGRANTCRWPCIETDTTALDVSRTQRFTRGAFS